MTVICLILCIFALDNNVFISEIMKKILSIVLFLLATVVFATWHFQVQSVGYKAVEQKQRYSLIRMKTTT